VSSHIITDTRSTDFYNVIDNAGSVGTTNLNVCISQVKGSKDQSNAMLLAKAEQILI
jgi:hypothetical protein